MCVGAVERLGDRVGDDGLRAALLDLAHEVPAQALLLHPVERLDAAASSRAGRPGRSCVPRTAPDSISRRIGVPWPASTPQSSLAVSAWASKWTMPMLPGPADLGDRGRARPRDRVVAAEHDRDGAGLGDLADLAIDHRVAAVDPRRDDVRVTGIDDGQDLERLDVELQGVDRARRVLRLADRPRPEPGARAVADRVVERARRRSRRRRRAAELGRVRDPRQLHERGRPDVGRQVEVVEDLVRRIPAVAGARSPLDVGRGLGTGTVGHGDLRRRRARPSSRAAADARRLTGGRRRFESARPAGRAGRRWYPASA